MEGSTENHIKSKRYFQKKFTEKLLILLSLGLTKEKLFEEIRNRIEKEDIREETADKLLRILDFVEKERMGKGEASPKWFSTHFTFSEKEILKKEYSVQKEPDHYMKAIRKHIESIYAEVKEKLNLEETNSPEELLKTEAPRWEASRNEHFILIEEGKTGKEELVPVPVSEILKKMPERFEPLSNELFRSFTMFTENYLLTETEEEILVYELPANGTIYSSIHLSEKFAKAELSGEVDDTFSIYGYPGKDYLFVISLITDKPSMTIRETLVNLNKSKTHSKDSSDKNRDFFVVETERRKTQQPEVSAETSIERDSFQKIEFEDHHKKFFEEVLGFDLSKHPIYEKREGIFSTLVMRVQETHGESEEHPDLEEIEEALQKTPIIQIPEKFQGKARILKTTTGSSFTPSTAAKAIFENLILSTVRTRGKNPGKDGSSSQTHGKAKPSPRQASGEKPESRKL